MLSDPHQVSFNRNVPQAVRDVFTGFLANASSKPVGELEHARKLREQDRRRLRSLAESDVAGSAWRRLRRLPIADDDALRGFAWLSYFWATNAALAWVVKRDSPQLYGRALRGARRLRKGGKATRAEMRADEKALWIASTPILPEHWANDASILRLVAKQSSLFPLEDYWKKYWKGDLSLTLTSVRKIMFAYAEFLDRIRADYEQVIASIPSTNYPLQRGTHKRIYRTALGLAAIEHFGSPCDEAVTDFVSAAFGGHGSLDTTRHGRRRGKSAR